MDEVGAEQQRAEHRLQPAVAVSSAPSRQQRRSPDDEHQRLHRHVDGRGADLPYPEFTIQVSDNFSHVRGRHIFKFGVDVQGTARMFVKADRN